jgi:hypothetical protein
MMDMTSGSLITTEGKLVRVAQDCFIGAVDSAKLSKTGAFFACWAVTNANGQQAVPPEAFLVVSQGKVIFMERPNAERKDISAKLGEATKLSGLKLNIPLDLIPAPLLPDFEFYAFDGVETATKLSYFAPNDTLSQIRIQSGSDYMRLIQTPSTRLRDPETLVFASLHALKRSPNDYAIGCAALCVIGYRLLDKEVVDDEIRNAFDEHGKNFVEMRPAIPFGLYLRWHTSLRLILGYLAYQAGNLEAARIHFERIIDFTADIATWPQSLTNILLGVFISGYLSDQSGNTAQAIQTWGRAEGILRYGAGVAQFQNFYAYGELGNAVRVAQECYVAMTAAKEGGVIRNVALAPEGRQIDLRQVPSPIGRLAAEHNARPAAAEQ